MTLVSGISRSRPANALVGVLVFVWRGIHTVGEGYSLAGVCIAWPALLRRLIRRLRLSDRVSDLRTPTELAIMEAFLAQNVPLRASTSRWLFCSSSLRTAQVSAPFVGEGRTVECCRWVGQSRTSSTLFRRSTTRRPLPCSSSALGRWPRWLLNLDIFSWSRVRWLRFRDVLSASETLSHARPHS